MVEKPKQENAEGKPLLIEHHPVPGQDNTVITLLTLNRPTALNAINTSLASALYESLRALESDQRVRCAILAAAGSKAFCVGADLKERNGMSQEEWAIQRRLFQEMFNALRHFTRPVIAIVDGYALGGGCELALLCDFIYASERAEFALPEVSRGIIPGGGGTQTFPRLVGKARAKEMILTGRRLNATEALAINLVNRVIPSKDLLAEAMTTAAAIAANAPIAVRQAKRAIDYGSEVDLTTGLAFENEAYWVTIPTEDRLEGVTAFNEKRAPRFTGK